MRLLPKKEPAVDELARKLMDRFGERNLVFTSDWDANPTALGVKNASDGNFLFYISTFCVSENRYFVEIENADRDVVLNGYKAGELKELDFEELSDLITKYLGLRQLYEN